MTEPACPCCNSEMDDHGDVVSGHIHYCGYCYGILASDRWLSSNMKQPILRNVKMGVFDGEPAGYHCPTCDGNMVKGPVSTNQGTTIEVDGCLKCGSLWFDNREIEPFVPEIRDLAHLPDNDPTSLFPVAKLAIAGLFGAISSITRRKRDDSEE